MNRDDAVTTLDRIAETDTVVDALEALADDLDDHEVCCLDDNYAMCGADVSKHPWVSDETPLTCAGCITADETNWCAHGKALCAITGEAG